MKITMLAAITSLLICFIPKALTKEPQKAPAALEQLLKERLQAAQQGYKAASNKGDEEKTYLWSRRWMEAERDMANNKAERVAALKGHFERMKKLELLALLAETRDCAPRLENLAPAKYYRAEAEIWLIKEKAR